MEEIIEEQVRRFIAKLPELQPDQAHLIMLAVRSRKARKLMGMKIKDLVVERRIVRPLERLGAWRERYFDYVHNLAVLQTEGFYHVKDNLVPAQAMGIFATLSPRAVVPAAMEIIKENVSYLHDRNYEMLSRTATEFFGRLHGHRAKGTLFQTIDIECPYEEPLRSIVADVLPVPIWMITRTSRGFHVILDLSKPSDAAAYYAPGKDGSPSLAKRLADKYSPDIVEFQRDSQEPIPGTLYFKEDSLEPNYVVIV